MRATRSWYISMSDTRKDTHHGDGPGAHAGRPPRDSRIESFAHGNRWWHLLTSDAFGFAGHDEAPRPLPRRTPYTIKKKMSEYLQAGLEKQARSGSDQKRPWAWDAFHAVFTNDRIKMPLDEAIPVPLEDLWWLAAADDLVLLSDRVTHHYTTVDHVAREPGRIFFIDQWPDQIFLKQGLNQEDVAAEVTPYMAGILDHAAAALSGKKQVSITRDEFLRVIVGTVTLDTPDLFDRYFTYRPEAQENFAIRFACGAALMDAEMDQLAKFAVPHYKAAWRVARANRSAGDADLAAARLYQSLVVARFAQQQSGGALAAKPFADELRCLLAQQREEPLFDSLGVEQIARMGNAAGHAQQFQAALGYLDRAVLRGPEHEGARHLRAMVKSRLDDWPGVVADITVALAANAERARAREAEKAARDRRDRHGLDDDQARIGGLRSRRLEELGLLFTALAHLQQWQEALRIAEEAVAIDPDRPEGYRMRGALAMEAGKPAEAEEHLSAARAREASARGRAEIDYIRASLKPAPPGEPG
ncbi:MAG: hypothetical protein AB7F74_11960 [Parvibaculaceae bacterium]